MKVTANITVALRPDISDVQGQTVERTLPSLGWSNVQHVKIGKHFVVELDAESPEAAKPQVEEMCKQILTNPILETFTFTLS